VWSSSFTRRRDSLAQMESVFQHIRSHKSAILYVTDAEDRFLLRFLAEATLPETKANTFVYNASLGLRGIVEYLRDWESREYKADPATLSLADTLTHIYKAENDKPSYYIITDAHRIFTEHVLMRRLLNILLQVQNNKASRKTLVLLTTSAGVPDALARHVDVVVDPGPEEAELTQEVKTLASKTGLTCSAKRASFRGLSLVEITNLFKEARVTGDRDITDSALFKYKLRRIKTSGIVEHVDTSGFDFSLVGGLDRFKLWAEKTRHAWTPAGQAFGLVPPRGVLNVGIYGCGKSLSVKALGKTWGLPVLQMEFGKLRSSLVGDSERNLYRLTRTLEGIGSCILYCDEAEKGFSGLGSSDKSDSGTQARLIGILSTWLQETKSHVCLALTANSLRGLPPEFVNRMDARFFFDLPTEEERTAIIKIHLAKLKLDPEKYPLYHCALASEGMVGREIEQALRWAMVESFAAGKATLDSADLINALKNKPRISHTLKDEIAEITSWVGYDPDRDDGVRALLASSRRPPAAPKATASIPQGGKP